MSPDDSVAAHKIEVKHRGNALGIWFFRQALKLFGLPGAYGLLPVVIVHYLVFDGEVRRQALAYIRRRFPKTGLVGTLQALYRLFLNQGQQLIDTYASLSGGIPFDLRMDDRESIYRLGNDPAGCVLLLSHVGNWKIVMPAFAQIKKNIYLVKRPEGNRAVADSLGVDRENSQIRLISPEGDFGGAVEIVKAITDGGMVAMMGDRRYGFDGVRIPSFLGAPAHFPYGAFHIAASCKVPLAIFLSAKTGPRQYTAEISRLLYPVYAAGRRKKDQVAEWVSEYAGVLEEFILKYPYQCFIFNDLWKE
jgi:predicted LPLAT superfamily acyltransferase